MISHKQWKIEVSKVLMVVTDNGSNMIKAINTCKQLLEKQAEAAGRRWTVAAAAGLRQAVMRRV
jgi:hypothetical protein